MIANRRNAWLEPDFLTATITSEPWIVCTGFHGERNGVSIYLTSGSYPGRLCWVAGQREALNLKVTDIDSKRMVIGGCSAGGIRGLAQDRTSR